jgi:SET domain-containing protein
MAVEIRIPILTEDLKKLGIEKIENKREAINKVRTEKLGLNPYAKQTQKAKICNMLGISPKASQKEFIKTLSEKLNKES